MEFHPAFVKTLLLHTCCGPCLACSRSSSIWHSGDVVAYFYNPNIQPLSEFENRLDSFKKCAKILGIPVLIDDSYPLRDFLRLALEAETLGIDRCQSCYRIRLEKTAKAATKGGFDLFSTTLLVSPYQKHELIIETGDDVGRTAGVEFAHLDFTDGWNEGRKLARREGIYMQGYCGCVFSELDRWQEKKRKRTTGG